MLTPRSGLVISGVFLLAAGTAAAQRVVTKPVEAPPATGTYGAGSIGGTTGGIGTELEAPSLGSSLPTIQAPVVVEQPQAAAPAAVAATAAPPPACRARSSSDCASEAMQCLTNHSISDSFAVEWQGDRPAIVRTYAYTTDEEENKAADCSGDLYYCLSDPC